MNTDTQRRPTPDTDAFWSDTWPVAAIVFARQLERERDEAREELADIRQRLKGHADSKLDGENGLAAATMRGFDQLQAENETMREAVKVSLIRAYTAGYQHGHEATVEGGFIPVHHSDETEFHAENIHQMLCDGSLPELQPLIKP